MPTASPQNVLTLGQIARRLKVPQHRVKYAIQQYDIHPIGRVGILRIWGEDDLPRIASALLRVGSNRGATV